MSPDAYFRAHASLGVWADPSGREIVATADGLGGVRVARTGAPTVRVSLLDWARLIACRGPGYRRVSSATIAQRSDLR